MAKSPWSLGAQFEADLRPVVLAGAGEICLEPVDDRQTNLIFHVYGSPHDAVEIAKELRELWNARHAKQEAA